MSATPSSDGKPNEQDPPKPIQVPVFSCVAYLSKHPNGGVHARVANLAGIECEAANEREALSKLVPAFKSRVAVLAARETPIPWIEPPSPKTEHEEIRLIPVHL